MIDNKTYDLIIIGGGPAGITAGIYGARQRLNTLVITKSFGGQVARKAVAIENYPGFEKISGMELIKRFEKHLRRVIARSDGHKIDIERDEVVKLKKLKQGFLVLTKSRQKFQAKAVIIASGADPKPLEVPGEKKFIGRGVSYCVQCDGPLFSNKTVAVLGSGNAGFETAISLSKLVKKIYILEYASEVIADKENQERVKKINKVEIIANAVLKQIKGNQFVNSIIYQDRKTKKDITLYVEGVFVEIGSIPATNFIRDLVGLNKKGEIKINSKTCMTKTAGIFAAGDVSEIKDKQIIIAAGQGAKAALSAYEYLEKFQN